MNRYSSRNNQLGEQFLNAKLQGAVSYDRIAGYFCSSILEVAGEAIEVMSGKARVICNSKLARLMLRLPSLVCVRNGMIFGGRSVCDGWGPVPPEETV